MTLHLQTQDCLHGCDEGPHVNRLLDQMAAALSPTAAMLLRRIAAQSGNRSVLSLRLSPASDFFSLAEESLLTAIDEEQRVRPASLRGRTILILKATRLCNLRCTYCNSWREGPGQIMELDVLARVIRDALLAPGIDALDIVWHGGEVTLLDPKYLQRALWVQERYRRPGIDVTHSIQTNATRLNLKWIQ